MELMTRADRERLERQLAQLHSLDLDLARRIAEARGQGDLRENADYHASREDKSHNDAKIRDLQARLAGAQVIDENSVPKDMVFVGAVVRLRDEGSGSEVTYRIVATLSEEEGAHRELTGSSPMGEALMKARVGDTVKVHLPRGERRLTVLEIVL